jgi:hypothetical protein
MSAARIAPAFVCAPGAPLPLFCLEASRFAVVVLPGGTASP